MKMSYLGMLVLLLALTIFSSSPVLATRDLSPTPGKVLLPPSGEAQPPPPGEVPSQRRLENSYRPPSVPWKPSPTCNPLHFCRPPPTS
ncbi:hypothetical protein Fmac_025027 [Flemingia macrophylla]|uniref:Uncharacterized protein n=1 Tax=Flemingia macrophylla TaxID=520843 RepID=A0ABD1LR38_9FABA